ncbi:MAG: ankyrin repeat domain-containing protein [Sedimentisphaerales bacterium]
MNNKRLISLTVCLILATVPGISSLILADIASETDTKAQQHFEKANELRKLADYDAAITEYKKVISLSPKSKIAQDAQYWIGQSYFEAGQFDAALSAFQKLLDEYPTSTIIPSTKLMMERVQQAKKNKSLFEAVKKGDIEQVKKLIAEGADVNETEDLGQVKWTPLIAAASGGDVQVVKVLLENGAKVDATESHGYTPLYYALWTDGNDSEELVRALIASGADVNKRSPGDKSYPPLVFAIWIREGREDNVKALLDAGADVDVKDDNGLTALYWAAFDSSKDVLDLILANGNYANTIHLAACRGDLSRIKTLIEEGTDVNTRDGFGCTPLHWAVLAESPDVADFLIAKGADINAKDTRNLSPLMAACALPVVELLISKGADIQGQDALQGQTKLHMACGGGEKDVADLLIRRGADVNLRDKRGQTPLWIAASGGHKEIVELLIKKGADINASNNRGRTPLAVAKQGKHAEVIDILRQHGATETLHGAVTSGNIGEVKRLLSEGKDVNSRDSEGQTPLHLAANRGHKEMVEVLIANGADIEARENRYSSTPLLNAAVRGRKEVVELLLSKGADIEGKNSDGLTPLNLTAAYGTAIHTEIIQLLLDRGADIESRSYGDCTPLQASVAVGRKGVAELLLAHGAKLDVISRHWGTPAHHAMRDNHPDLVRWCISKGIDIPPMHQAAYFGDIDKVRSLLSTRADVNQKDKAEFTPLHCAVFGRRKEIVQLLIENNADVKAISCGHTTPLFWACERGYLDMVKLLVDNGAEVNGRAFRRMTWGPSLLDNWSNLHMAAHAGHADVVEYLLDNSADIHAKCTRGDEGLTPLHLAARNGYVNAVKVLLAKGADASMKSNAGRTALDLAKEKNHSDIVELLKKHGAKEESE